MESSSVWNGQDPTLSVGSQDDFQQFLEMGMNNLSDGLPFDFQDFNQQQAQASQLLHRDDRDGMDTRMENTGGLAEDATMREQIPSATSAASHPAIHGTPIGHTRLSDDSLVDLDAQIQYLQQQRHQQQQRQLQEQQRNYYVQNSMIPPTPNSMELHGANGQFYPQSDPQQQAMYERYRAQKEAEMAFTPLVSPAVTPLDAHFNIPEYTVPGAYFSPLSSPALHAQNESSSVYDQLHSGTTDSPNDGSHESHSAPSSSLNLARRSSRKVPPPKPRATRSVRQSPIVKPRKAKKNGSTSILPQTLSQVMEPMNPHITRSKETSSSRSTASTEGSENDSISPEHLSDMAPPPVPPPGSAGRSPFISAQKENSKLKHLSRRESPATPASLMRLTQSPQVGHTTGNHDMDIDEQGMEGFALPEAANPTQSSFSRIDAQSDGQTTPTLGSTGLRTPGFQPLPSPAISRPKVGGGGSASQSPQIEGMNGANGSRRTPQIAPRGSKKRTSSSVLASPALLPRISPSIKPLLPGGGAVTDDTASLLLASKSNYQNILEGTHLPGVSYPTELSTNLTSKRTSHKIAEQGRRNRINSALQEIATLLPRGPSKDSSGDKSGSGENNECGHAKAGAQSANSKASTVEQAIEYIKQLKKELADATQRAEQAEKKLEEKA
ncbi:hypothetical protein B7494_g8445 [Chlorociboria aeruginascens]|nr:hypothetical protein B7494_g8445 [Chlorociboria aeruginascens]